MPASLSPLLLPPVNTVTPTRLQFSRFGRQTPGYVPLEFHFATVSFAWTTSFPVSTPPDSSSHLSPASDYVNALKFDSREKPGCLHAYILSSIRSLKNLYCSFDTNQSPSFGFKYP